MNDKIFTTTDARSIANFVDDIYALAAIRSLADQLDAANKWRTQHTGESLSNYQKLMAIAKERDALLESLRLTQEARREDRARLQQKCSDWKAYWRASDAHGVRLTVEQAVELLQDALGVEVEIKP